MSCQLREDAPHQLGKRATLVISRFTLPREITVPVHTDSNAAHIDELLEYAMSEIAGRELISVSTMRRFARLCRIAGVSVDDMLDDLDDMLAEDHPTISTGTVA